MIERPWTPTLGRAAAALGTLSALLLVAAVRWAHHWGLLADSIVAAWGLCTLGSVVVAGWVLLGLDGSRGYAKLGLWLGILSVASLAVAAGAAAGGFDPAGACGGG